MKSHLTTRPYRKSGKPNSITIRLRIDEAIELVDSLDTVEPNDLSDVELRVLRHVKKRLAHLENCN